jgi:hypothetical protein
MPTRISSVQGRNRGLGQPPLHERSKYGQAEHYWVGPIFGSGPRWRGRKEGLESFQDRAGQGGRAASPGLSTNDRMRVLLGGRDVGFGVWKLGI